MASKFDSSLNQAILQYKKTMKIIKETARLAKKPEDGQRFLDLGKMVMEDGINLYCLKAQQVCEKILLRGSEENENDAENI